MAAGVQLTSEVHLACFQPTVDQYLKKIQEAIASGDLADAQQALAQLKNTVTGVGQADGKGGTARQQTGLQDVSAALANGDLADAERAVNDLQQPLSAANSRQEAGESNRDGGPPRGGTEADSSAPNSMEESTGNLDVRA